MITKEGPFFDIKIPSDLPVIIGTWHTGFKFADHGEEYSREVGALLDAQTSPVYYIMDMNQLEDISVEGIVLSANRGARGANPNLHHAMNRGSIIVAKAAVLHLAAKGLDTSAFGNVKVKLFESVEDALDYVRAAVEAEDRD
jgi:hypothetical protein